MDNRRHDKGNQLSHEAGKAAERRALAWVLAINLTHVVVAGAVGLGLGGRLAHG